MKSVAEADVIISPDIESIHWADYKKLDFCIKKGREAAIQALPEIRRKMRRTIFYRLRKIFKR